MKTKILLTGSTGFVGRQTVPMLLEKGHEIHALTNQSQPIGQPGVISHPCNLFDEKQTIDLLKKICPEKLLHFAWITAGAATSLENGKWLEASLRLVQSFVENGGKRVVIAGSCAEYEPGPLCTEADNSFQASTYYGQCKRRLYLELKAFAKKVPFELAWGYLFYLYGPYERPDRFIPTLIRGILKKEPIPLTEGLQVRDFLHVREAAEGFVKLLDSSVQGCFNIASGKGISIRKMAEKVAVKMGGEKWLQFGARPLSPFDSPTLVANIEKIQTHLSWSPSLTLDQGLDEVIAWWKNAPF